jgi:hypothetical protein
MKRFVNQLSTILENLGEATSGKIDILHVSGKHIIADHIKKVKSPKGGRHVVVAGIGAPEPPAAHHDRHFETLLKENWTFRLRDFYTPYRDSARHSASDIAIERDYSAAHRGTAAARAVFSPRPRTIKIKKNFKHVLVIDMRNIVSIDGKPVRQQPAQAAGVTQQQSPVAPQQPGMPGIG